MRSLICFLFHRPRWTVLVPGFLPFKIDAYIHCDICDRDRGTPGRAYSNLGAFLTS